MRFQESLLRKLQFPHRTQLRTILPRLNKPIWTLKAPLLTPRRPKPIPLARNLSLRRRRRRKSVTIIMMMLLRRLMRRRLITNNIEGEIRDAQTAKDQDQSEELLSAKSC